MELHREGSTINKLPGLVKGISRVYVRVGVEVRVGNDLRMGDDLRIGDDARIGDELTMHYAKKRPLFFKLDCLPRQASK